MSKHVLHCMQLKAQCQFKGPQYKSSRSFKKFKLNHLLFSNALSAHHSDCLVVI